jgi:hypothetical protein
MINTAKGQAQALESLKASKDVPWIGNEQRDVADTLHPEHTLRIISITPASATSRLIV